MVLFGVEALTRQGLMDGLPRSGLKLVEAADSAGTLALVRGNRIDAILCGADGDQSFARATDLARQIRMLDRLVPIVLAAESGGEAALLAALRVGVSEFLVPPITPEDLAARIRRLVHQARGARASLISPACRESAGRHPKARPELIGNERLLGESQAMLAVRKEIAASARVDSNVLLTGETGTGKELAAELIHKNSARRQHPFACVSCAAVPDTLFESEMFGFARGAFTGAYVAREGKLKQAEGGTIFLDEIGEMTPSAQAKLLRAIERKEIQRLGGRESSRIDVRLIAATNQSLEELVATHRFRRDLFFRVNVIRIHLPPLRDRAEDIPLLSAHFLAELGRQLGRVDLRLSPEALDFLARYPWPGNIRELRNVLEAAAIRGSQSVIEPADFPPDFHIRFTQTAQVGPNEKDRLLSALIAVNWDKSKAARRLQWSRATLYRKLARYNISKPDWRGRES